jgi:hypothetical protein
MAERAEALPIVEAWNAELAAIRPLRSLCNGRIAARDRSRKISWRG